MESKDQTPPREPFPGTGPAFIEIDTARPRRWLGWIGWLMLYILAAGGLGLLLYRFTRSPWLAGLLVVFMSLYMLLMGYLAMRNIRLHEREDRGDR